MKKSLKFAIAIHIHQPVGNFDFVMEEAYLKSYLPFFQVLEKHPKIKISVHITGILNEWIEKTHSEWMDLIRKMVHRGQIQLLSGGYYEPILSVIPPEDRYGQIEKQNKYIKDKFDSEARGMWLAERVWEPTLPTCMAKAGMEFTVIDDVHFKYAGLQKDQLFNYYVTEDLGNKINLFPISQELRYLIPFQKPEKTIEYLNSLSNFDGNRIVVFADDGEKFGLWPDTYDFVYKEKWLDKFFNLLEKHSDSIHILHFSEVIDNIKPAGNVYLPTASYAEMLHWALPNKAFKAYEEFEDTLKESELFDKFGIFVRGGFWRNFFSKYAESNNLHKKMMLVAEKIKANRYGISGLQWKQAQDHLWAGQCNCPYWHGVFGGLYLPHLRTAIYENLIMAENIMDNWDNVSVRARIEIIDFDKNGTDEVLVETRDQNLYFSLLDGGTLFEHDLGAVNFNIHDTMARREEGYHKKLLDISGQKSGKKKGIEPASIHDLVVVKEKDLEKKLHYDQFLPRSMRLHIFPLDTEVDDLYSAKELDLSNSSNVEFELVEKKIFEKEVYLFLFGKAIINFNGESVYIDIHKKIRIPLQGFGFSTEYSIHKDKGVDLELKLGIDHFYTMLGGASDDRYFFDEKSDLGKPHLNSKFVLEDRRQIGLIDEWKKIKVVLKINRVVDFFVYPIETISLSEAGFERVYQASAIVPTFNLKLSTKSETIEIKELIEIF